MKPIAWVTGAGGLIGSCLASSSFDLPWTTRPLDRATLDLTHPQSVEAAFRRDNPALVIHCAAISKSPACQANPDLAHRTNVDATRHLAELSSQIPFFFLSTDLVFDGRKGDYTETDSPNPLSKYAETKVAAESFILRNPRHTIIRTSLNGGRSPTRNRGFNEEMRLQWEQGKTLHLFIDEFRSPIAAIMTARAIWELARQQASGIFHVAGAEKLSRYQIGLLLAQRHPQLKPLLLPGTLKEYQGPPRSPDTTLDCSKAQKLLSFPLPRFSEWLACNPSVEF
ncbi:MAG: SDR family oxidoreductase [Verrucomicrobiota bacterium]|nr:SDR family oxidoreductase [Verrucomicrobiota bacterium]